MNTVTVTDLGNGSVSLSKITTGEVVTLAKATTDWKSDVTYLTLMTLIYSHVILTVQKINLTFQ